MSNIGRKVQRARRKMIERQQKTEPNVAERVAAALHVPQAIDVPVPRAELAQGLTFALSMLGGGLPQEQIAVLEKHLASARELSVSADGACIFRLRIQ